MILALTMTTTAWAGEWADWSDGVFVWTYAGREAELLDGARSDGWTWVDDSEPALAAGPSDALRIDAEGDVYRVESFDRAALAEKLGSTSADVDEAVDESFPDETWLDGEEPYVGWVYDTPLSWSVEECDSAGNEDWVWNSDSRTWVNSPMDNREEKAVVIVRNGSPMCSGVMVDSDSVLTAAHCLWTSGGSAISVGQLGVCSRENLQSGADCSTVEAKIIPSGYTIGSDPIGLDFALLDLDETDITDGEFMALSSASDSSIAAEDQDTTGYPGYLPGSCSAGSGTSNDITNNSLTVDDSYDGAKAFRETGSITWTGADWFGTTLDAVSGQSGSPIYYFPSSGSTTHFVTAVLSRGRSIIGPAYIAGPKVSQFKSFVEANK